MGVYLDKGKYFFFINNVTFQLGTPLLGKNCGYGTHFLAEKRCVQNATLFWSELKKKP